MMTSKCTLAAGVPGDLTQRKETEEQLRLAATVFEHSPEGILITDPDNRIRSVNRAFTRITGYTQADYEAWRANFGTSWETNAAGSLGGAKSAVPEPATAWLLLAVAATLGEIRKRQSSIAVGAT